MELKLRLGGIVFFFNSERELIINHELKPYIVELMEMPDVMIYISWDWEHVDFPQVNMIGQDAILNYYEEKNVSYCIARGGPKGAIACTKYTRNFEKMICTINEKPFLQPPKALGSILRMIPMRAIFLHFHIIFLHASQITLQGKGVLFAAPSGTGKSTQAKLWQQFRNAEIVCNDRTLLRQQKGEWLTYGYPLDGSEPVCSNKVNRLGCVVLLKQGIVNEAQRLRACKAISLLMPQVVMDCWDSSAKVNNMQLLINLMEDIPVYLLTCTPDERAVEVLESKLIEEGVISDGNCF